VDEFSALSRDLYLITHNTQEKQASILPAGFKPASEPAQIHALGRAAAGIGSILTINSDYYPNSNRLFFNMDIHGFLCEVGTESSYTSTEHLFSNV
jgi:hypothetical protein